MTMQLQRRLAVIHAQLCAGRRTGDSLTRVPPAASQQPTNKVLLSDSEVKRFIISGWHILEGPQLGLDPSVHDANYRDGLAFDTEAAGSRESWTEALERRAPLIAENMTSRAPSLRGVCSSPAVVGALESLLGQGYALHPHTFLHKTTSSSDQQFHKDGILPW
jgi:hypothetical protein